MHMRMSPIGGTPISVRSFPDEPPSSATVTTAVMLLVTCLSPRSSTDKPVPPPIATMRGPRALRSPLIEQICERFPGHAVRLDEGAHDAPSAVDEQRGADGEEDQRPDVGIQELQGDHVDDVELLIARPRLGQDRPQNRVPRPRR